MARKGGSNQAFVGGLLGFVVLAIMAVFIYFLVIGKEKFNVPVKPSQYQDQRFRTPAGNTIVY